MKTNTPIKKNPSFISLEDIKLNDQFWQSYKKLVYDCDKNNKHLKQDNKNNLCKHCYRNLVLPESNREKIYASELKAREKLSSEKIPCDAPIWMDSFNTEKIHKEFMNLSEGFEKYKNSLSD